MEWVRQGRTLGMILGTFLVVALSVRADDAPQGKPSGGDCEGQVEACSHYLTIPSHESREEQIFNPKAVRIDSRCYLLVNGKKEHMEETSLWFSQGALYFRWKTPKAREPMPNIATIDGKVYVWHSNKKEGWILDRFESDTSQCARYIVDPSFCMQSVWSLYRRNPELFVVKKDGNTTVITCRKQILGDAIVTLVFREEPLWFCSIQYTGRDGKVFVCEVDPPVVLKEVPAEAKKLPEGIPFKAQPGLTLREFMVFV